MPGTSGIYPLAINKTSGNPNPKILPALRQDLRLYRGPRDADGSPTWTLYDPVRDSYYRIGWSEFEMLARWEKNNIDTMLKSVNRETTLNLNQQNVRQLIHFLVSQELVTDCRYQNSEKPALLTRLGLLFQKYLFMKLPLFRPNTLLSHLLPYVRFMYNKLFFKCLGITAIIALLLVMRQWDSYVNTFSHIASPLAAPWLIIGLVLTKIFHEFGHALTAKYYGLNVPTMGIAFLVAWPVLYTDTNAAWKLRSRRARLAIDGAGVLAETILAVVATVLWLILPDGPQRDAVCFIATITWAITLMVNGNPLMRFDGYYILCDLINFPNLQQRSFALARWYTRKALLGSTEPVPEKHTPRKTAFLTVFAWACWAYRLFLFSGIAAFLYYFTFKLLGIVLAVSVISWFIVRPVWIEINSWIDIRQQLSWNPKTKRTLVIFVSVLLFLFVPWSQHIHVPALLQYQNHTGIYSPYSARIKSVLAKTGDTVSADQILFELDSPELDHQIASNARQIIILQQQLNQQLAQKEVLEKSTVLQEQLATAITERDGLQRQKLQLSVRTPIPGNVADIADGLSPGMYVNTNIRLALIVNKEQQTVFAYVPESDIDRISIGNSASFMSDSTGLSPIDAVITSIVPMPVLVPKEHLMASEYGGPVDVVRDQEGHLQPSSAIYKVTLPINDSKAPLDNLTLGSARIACEGESIASSIYQSIAGLIVREGGF